MSTENNILVEDPEDVLLSWLGRANTKNGITAGGFIKEERKVIEQREKTVSINVNTV